MSSVKFAFGDTCSDSSFTCLQPVMDPFTAFDKAFGVEVEAN